MARWLAIAWIVAIWLAAPGESLVPAETVASEFLMDSRPDRTACGRPRD